MGIECGEALEGQNGRQKVAPHVAHHTLDVSLVIALAGAAEPVIEQEVGLQLSEGTGAFTTAVAQALATASLVLS